MTPVEKVMAFIYFVGVAGSVVFVIRRVTTRFWRWAEGMALLLQHLMLVGFGAQTILVLKFGGYPGRIPLAMALLIGFSGAVWWLTILQERAQMQARVARVPLPGSHPPVEDHQVS